MSVVKNSIEDGFAFFNMLCFKLITSTSKVRSLYSEQVETDLCAAFHAFTLHVHVWRKLKMLCVLADDCSLRFSLLGRFWAKIVL